MIKSEFLDHGVDSSKRQRRERCVRFKVASNKHTCQPLKQNMSNKPSILTLKIVSLSLMDDDDDDLL